MGETSESQAITKRLPRVSRFTCPLFARIVLSRHRALHSHLHRQCKIKLTVQRERNVHLTGRVGAQSDSDRNISTHFTYGRKVDSLTLMCTPRLLYELFHTPIGLSVDTARSREIAARTGSDLGKAYGTSVSTDFIWLRLCENQQMTDIHRNPTGGLGLQNDGQPRVAISRRQGHQSD